MCTTNCSKFKAVTDDSGATVKIDLPKQTLTTPSGRTVGFPVDGFSKHCLVEGVDELGFILQHESDIAAYEAQRVGSIDTHALRSDSCSPTTPRRTTFIRSSIPGRLSLVWYHMSALRWL
jgi:hypothetical protein